MNNHLLLKNNIKEFRRKKGLTQSDLAIAVSCSKNTISSLETNRFCPSAYLAFWLCSVLDCSFWDLFYLSEDADHE